MLKKLFGRKSVTVIDSPKYKNLSSEQLVEVIHNDFKSASDKLLEEAKAIINSKTIDYDSVRALEKFGFINPEYGAMKEILEISFK